LLQVVQPAAVSRDQRPLAVAVATCPSSPSDVAI
jgi:hypothetical protein